MTKPINGYLLLLFLLLVMPAFTQIKEKQTAKDKKFYWRTLRGVNAGTRLTRKDIADLKDWNVNLVRISMATLPVMEMKPPYRVNEAAFVYLDSVVNWCEAFNISVVIDPHRYPGMGHQWTMLGKDSVWLDFKYHDIIVNIWDKISNRYKNRGKVIAAYDILNEPESPPTLTKGVPNDINLLYQKIVVAIRKNDKVHTICLSLPRYYKDGKMHGYHKGIALLKLPKDDNLVLQTHTYMPDKFTHQNVWEQGEFVHYPGLIDGEYWDVKRLKEEQAELITFSRKNPKIPILVGEFSCPRWTGEDGIRYLSDVIQIAEENNWSWAYHSFRESHVWDAEKPGNSRTNSSIRDYSNPRFKLLAESFSKNKK